MGVHDEITEEFFADSPVQVSHGKHLTKTEVLVFLLPWGGFFIFNIAATEADTLLMVVQVVKY